MKETENYIVQASFILEDEDVDKDWWYREPFMYSPTNNWVSRSRELAGVVETEDLREVMQKGDIYAAVSNTVAFVKDFGGVVLYVVVAAELKKDIDSYPSTPDKSDYRFKAVTIWPYIYDRNKAETESRFTIRGLNVMKQIMEQNKGDKQ